MMNGLSEEIRVGDEVSIKDENEFSFGDFHSAFKRASFITRAVGAVKTVSIKAAIAKALSSSFRNFDCLISRVVENLDLKFILRVIKGRDSIEKAVNDMHLIENGQLHSHERKFLSGEFTIRLGTFFTVLEVKKKNGPAVETESGKAQKNDGVREIPGPG